MVRRKPRRRHAARVASTAAAALLVVAGPSATESSAAPAASGTYAAPETGTAPAAPEADTPSYLRRDTEAVHRAGAVGVLADLRDGDRRARARAGVAELGTDRPVAWHSSIRVGSATKAFTATVALQLVGEGLLSLDDTVERWLPGLVTGNGNDGRAITIRHLLQHTSGLPTVSDLPGWENAEQFEKHRYDAHDPRYVVKLAMRHPPSSVPGARWEYSNTNYTLAGLVIEAVTGRSWDHEVTSRIIVPLELTGTFVPGHRPYLPLPHPHTYYQFAEGEPWFDTTVLNMKDADAEGSMVSTTEDLGRFHTALIGGKLLKRAELAEMMKTVPVPEFTRWGMRYGLGLMWFDLSCGGGYWTHWGDTLGASTRGGITPDGKRGIVVSTSGNGDHLKIPMEDDALHPLVDNALCRGLS
ncbi:serine hydrolase domain-containing protein [Streptomyces sp. NBC_00829]|uniref:serine hydrolase domain-containing protein n=1 Tax=Streptomyces sp. NBC_00829 TaxID=2903679 RepID=UPI00386670CC|nr:beta-lactamase family protein [Streptomyces sp. NBC_00829]